MGLGSPRKQIGFKRSPGIGSRGLRDPQPNMMHQAQGRYIMDPVYDPQPQRYLGDPMVNSDVIDDNCNLQ